MTGRFSLTHRAQRDIEDIWRYIAEDNPAAADRIETALYDAFAMLARNPQLGHKRVDLTRKPVRFWSVHSYMVIYDPRTQPLHILRVLSGYRDVSAILDGDA